jgi:two-component system chemotaxis response regulator CheB
MPKLRVLVVDDSVVIRRMLSDCLASDPELEVVGTAADGKIGLAKIAQLNPDLVTLDMEMPVMDGLETLKTLRKVYFKLPVIMFSTLTERGASATLDALALGANDYVTKPANVGSVSTAMQRIREELVPKIKALCRRSAPALASPALRKPILTTFAASTGIDVLTIGVSTGGPNALAAMLPGLAANFPVPVVIVQHMPPLFTRLLAERISSVSSLRAREGENGALLRAGELWVAPGGSHMEVERATDGVRLRLHEGPPENSCRPAVDVLFRSVARAFGARTLAVVLTGMGQDGLCGCQYIREAGGQVIAQDEASSVVWGMPGAVAQAGLAEKILPLNEIATEINRRVESGVTRTPFFPSRAPSLAFAKVS